MGWALLGGRVPIFVRLHLPPFPMGEARQNARKEKNKYILAVVEVGAGETVDKPRFWLYIDKNAVWAAAYKRWTSP